MKKIYKVMLALGAVLGVVVLALVWLVRGAIGVAEDVVDTAANTVDSVTAKVKEPANAEQPKPAPIDKGSLAQVAEARPQIKRRMRAVKRKKPNLRLPG